MTKLLKSAHLINLVIAFIILLKSRSADGAATYKRVLSANRIIPDSDK